MRVIVSSRLPEIAASIAIAASSAGIVCEVEPSLQQLGSRLFRDPDSLGVYWAAGPASAVETARQLRLAEVRNVLFVVLDTETDTGRAARGRVLALAAGVDDAQHWPVDDAELIARLHALHRRNHAADPTVIEMAGAAYYPERSIVEGPGGSVYLSGQENTLLELMATRPGVCVTKAMCMLALYQQRDEAQIKIVDVFVCKLRKKLAPVTGGLDVIATVWGTGYRFIPAGYEPVVVDFRKRVVAAK